MSLVLQVLNTDFEVMMVLDEKGIINVTIVHPEGDMSICTKFLGNPSSSCRDATKNVNFIVALYVRGPPNLLGFILWAP